MVRWIGGSQISKTRYWVKEFKSEGEQSLRNYINGMRYQYVEAKKNGKHSAAELAELVECGKYAAAEYRKAYGKDCPDDPSYRENLERSYR